MAIKLNKEKFMKTEMGAELEETIRCWDRTIEEKIRRKRIQEAYELIAKAQGIIERMNKIRRKQIQEASELIAKAQGIIESVKDDEQEAHDNLPESIQYGEKGQQMEEYIDMLDKVYGHCDDLMSIIDEIQEEQT